MVKLRLTRMGATKAPFYRIVAMDSRKARDGKYIDQIGIYNPVSEPKQIVIDADKAKEWLAKAHNPPTPLWVFSFLKVSSRKSNW